MFARLNVAVLCAVTATAAIGGACRRSDSVQTYIARGDGYAKSGQYDAAILEYRNAAKKANKSADPYLRLGDAYLAIGKSEEAYRAYTNASDADSTASRAYIEAGRLLLAAKLYDQAKLRAEQVIDRDPLYVDAHVLQDRAVGEAAFDVGDRDNAEAAFRSAVVDGPESAEAHAALAQFLIATNRQAEAEQVLLAGVKAAPDDELANRALASFYLSSGRPDAAEPYLKTAAARMPQRFRSTLALADYYFSFERYDDARAVLAKGTGDAIRVRLAAIEYATGSTPAARSILEKVLKKRPNAEGLALNARILTDERKLDDAIKAAKAALALEPRLAAAYYVVGSAELERGNFDEAVRALQEALRINKNDSATRLQLARANLGAGHAADAVALASASGSGHDARMTLAHALIADNQLDRARAELTRLIAEDPSDPDPQVAMGTLDLDSGNTPSAAAHAERALADAPQSPSVLQLAGRVAIAQGDSSKAIDQLGKATAADPTSFDAHALLAHAYASRGDLDKARTTLEGFAHRNPGDAAPLTAIGIIFQQAGRNTEARKWYEQAIVIDSKDAMAAHGLARIYAGDPTKNDEAVDLARTAVARMPDQADVHDTLGSAYVKVGRLSAAAPEFERAVALQPRDETFQQHLADVKRALALEKEKEQEKAKAAAVQASASR